MPARGLALRIGFLELKPFPILLARQAIPSRRVGFETDCGRDMERIESAMSARERVGALARSAGQKAILYLERAPYPLIKAAKAPSCSSRQGSDVTVFSTVKPLAATTCSFSVASSEQVL